MRQLNPMTRRRVLRISAAAGGIALAGGPMALATQGAHIRPQRWHGTALGAEASIILYHPDRAAGARLIRDAVAEIARLERIFSLYRADSALCQLNRDGALEAPAPELVQLTALAQSYGEVTAGAFDATVQPLWALYAGHFARPDADPAGPPESAVRRVLELVDYRAVEIDSGRIAFARPGMAATLNGIAQGWITDRVTERFRDAGLTSVLVNLGEIRGLGAHPDGTPWTAGLRDPSDAGRIVRTVTLDSAALATSAGYGFRFDAAGRHHHLFDPRTGRSTARFASVSVLAPRATAADALSTALACTDETSLPALAGRLGEATAFFTRSDGTSFTWRA